MCCNQMTFLFPPCSMCFVICSINHSRNPTITATTIHVVTNKQIGVSHIRVLTGQFNLIEHFLVAKKYDRNLENRTSGLRLLKVTVQSPRTKAEFSNLYNVDRIFTSLSLYLCESYQLLQKKGVIYTKEGTKEKKFNNLM